MTVDAGVVVAVVDDAFVALADIVPRVTAATIAATTTSPPDDGAHAGIRTVSVTPGSRRGRAATGSVSDLA